MFSLVAAAFIMVMFVNLGISFATNEQFFKRYQAFDIKYTLHTLEAVPGNAVIFYPENTSYMYIFKDQTVTVKSQELEGNRQFGQAYLVTQDFTQTLDYPSALVFTKIGPRIVIDDKQTADINLLQCENTQVTAVKMTYDDLSKPIAEHISKNSPFIVGSGMDLRIQKGDPEKAIVYYNIKDTNAKNAACNLATSMAKNFQVSGYSIVPQDRQGIRLEYGWDSEPEKMAAAIIEGLR